MATKQTTSKSTTAKRAVRKTTPTKKPRTTVKSRATAAKKPVTKKPATKQTAVKKRVVEKRTTSVKQTEKKPNPSHFKKGNTKGGRTKGSENKVTRELKACIMDAFDRVGHVDYLVSVALGDPKTFCGLLGKILPAEIKATMEHTGDITYVVNTGATNRPPIGVNNPNLKLIGKDLKR